MLQIYEVFDPDAAGYRLLFSSAVAAQTYSDGVKRKYGSAIKLQRHLFEDVGGLLAFIEEDLRDWNPHSTEIDG